MPGHGPMLVLVGEQIHGTGNWFRSAESGFFQIGIEGFSSQIAELNRNAEVPGYQPCVVALVSVESIDHGGEGAHPSIGRPPMQAAGGCGSESRGVEATTHEDADFFSTKPVIDGLSSNSLKRST